MLVTKFNPYHVLSEYKTGRMRATQAILILSNELRATSIYLDDNNDKLPYNQLYKLCKREQALTKIIRQIRG